MLTEDHISQLPAYVLVLPTQNVKKPDPKPKNQNPKPSDFPSGIIS